jgi:hypothetical protein
MPSQWLDTRKLRFINHDFFISPFLDLALLEDPRLEDSRGDKTPRFSFDDMLVTGGLEFTVFPLSWRAFILRFSFGFDLREIVQSKKVSGVEFFFGLGHFY